MNTCYSVPLRPREIATMARKPTEYVQFKLRVREGLRAKIEREAKKRGESTNNEAVERLEKSFEAEQRMAAFTEQFEARIDDWRQRWEQVRADAEAAKQQFRL